MIKSAFVFAIKRTLPSEADLQEVAQERFEYLIQDWKDRGLLHTIQLWLIPAWLEKYTESLADYLGVDSTPEA